MSTPFKPVWGDSTMARQICHPYRHYFLIEPIIGLGMFILFGSKSSIVTVGFSLAPEWLIKLCTAFDVVFLPRSLIELAPIREHYGDGYFYHAALMFFLCAVSGIGLTISILITSDIQVSDSISTKQTLVRCLVATVFLSLQIPQFRAGPFAADYIDPDGFFFVKSSILIGVGYYYLCMLIVDFVGRIWWKGSPALTSSSAGSDGKQEGVQG